MGHGDDMGYLTSADGGVGQKIEDIVADLNDDESYESIPGVFFINMCRRE